MNKYSSPTRCNQCGDLVTAANLGAEGKRHVEGTAGTRTRGTVVVCSDCNAAGEYQQHLYRQQLQAELLASLPEALRARYLAQEAAGS